MNNIFKKFISIILVLVMVLGVMPLGGMFSYADGEEITSIEVSRQLNVGSDDSSTYEIIVRGKNLKNAIIEYVLSGTSISEELTNEHEVGNNTDEKRMFKITVSKAIKSIEINGEGVELDNTEMPSIKEIDKNLIDIDEDEGEGKALIKIIGNNFEKFKNQDNQDDAEYEFHIDDFEYTEDVADGKLELNKEKLEKQGLGHKNIELKREKETNFGSDAKINLITTYHYNNAYRIYKKISIDDDITIFPNKGKKGTEIDINIKNNAEKFSIFFLRKAGSQPEPFYHDNMGRNTTYTTFEGDMRIKTTVPDSEKINLGNYYVFITNKLDLDVIKKEKGTNLDGIDLTEYITRQKEIGKFEVTDVDTQPQITYVSSYSGSSDGEYVKLEGKLLEELTSISGFSDSVFFNKNGNELKEKERFDKEISVVNEDGISKLRFTYFEDNDNDNCTYNNKKIKNLTRDITVYIGDSVRFEEGYLKNKDKFEFINGPHEIDKLYFRTPGIGDNEETKHEIRLNMVTEIETDGGIDEFSYSVVADKPYEYEPSYIEPIIEKANPKTIEVISDSDKKTTKHTRLSIKGENFSVYRYTKNGQIKITYPKLIIGGNDEDRGIIIEKKEDGKVYYNNTPIEDAIFDVFRSDRKEVIGNPGNQVGARIIVSIPENTSVKGDVPINEELPISIANPRRDSDERRGYRPFSNLIKFTVESAEVQIAKVIVNGFERELDNVLLSTEGEDDVTLEITGSKEDMIVYIDGEPVPLISEEIGTDQRKILKFKSPKNREGKSILHVMDSKENGDAINVIYTTTMEMDPKIEEIRPSEGTKDILVKIEGDGFLKGDQTVTDFSGLGPNRLIGTRVFLNNDDVNTYVGNKKNPNRLADYCAPNLEDEVLFRVEEDLVSKINKVVISSFYKSATIKDGDDYYSIIIDKEGKATIRGKEDNYIIQLLDDNIVAIDSKENILNVDIDSKANKLIIGDKELNVDFNNGLFSIGNNESGRGFLKVADYYESIFLELDGNGIYYAIDADDTGKVIISDGINTSYEIRFEKDKIIAIQGTESYPVKVTNNSITIGDGSDAQKFCFKTPFATDTKYMIVGHKTKVESKNKIWVTIPDKGNVKKVFDVKVVNPDDKVFSEKDGFTYYGPSLKKPIIHSIEPNQRSIDGGKITIYGENFDNNMVVSIAGTEVPEKDTIVNKSNYKEIEVIVPKYPGDVDEDFVGDKKYVPVQVQNRNNKSGDVRVDLFAYVRNSSNPIIGKDGKPNQNGIYPSKGSLAGGDVVEIWGADFRYYEKYTGENPPKKGDTNYDDIDRNNEWTNYINDSDVPDKFKKPIDHKDFLVYIDSPVLPTVYFGKEKAKIVEFRDGYIKAITPRGRAVGTTNVYVENNDGSPSNYVDFTYEGSNPYIEKITPSSGRKQGGENKDIKGSGFKTNAIDVIDEDKNESRKNMYLVRFGEIDNIEIPRKAENSGLINQGIATVNLDGGLKIEYKVVDGSTKVIISLGENNKTYSQEYDYTSGAKYIDVKGLKDKEDKENNYKGNELIKVEVDDGRLLVARGYSPEANERTTGELLEVKSPSYYSIGNVNVVVENPDGISNKYDFYYSNPDSNPKITNITRDGQQPQPGDDGEIKILTVNIKGGSEIVIEGSDFRDVQRIQIGNVLNIEPGDILMDEPNRLVFKMPTVDDRHATEFLHRVVVTNYDGGIASSDEAHPPIYIQFTKGESNPEIEGITPPRGPDTGGNTVIMKGKDFRETMDGYAGEKLKVYFDGKQVPDNDVRVIDYKTISVIAPPGKPGSVEVKVENPDGEMSNTVQYTYASNPRITSVVDPLDSTEKAVISAVSIEGGQEIKLKGTGFMENARVYFAPKVTPVTGSEEGTGRIIYIEGNPYILQEGTEGTEYNFIDDETVTIKTPALKAGSSGVIIVNQDDGASPIYTNLIYGLPEIAAPSWIAAELVYDRFIRVHWGAVSGATEYEIFVVVDDKTTELIGSTGLTSFAYNDLEPRTRYRFIVKAVGDFGSSKPSMESNTVRTGRVVGPPDEDGGLGEETSMSKAGNVANVVIGTNDRGTAPVTIDLTGGTLAGSTEVVISMSAEVIVNSGNRNIQVIGKDFSLNFRPSAFNVAAVRENRNRTDAGVRFIIAPDEGNTQVPSGNQLSTVYNLDASVYIGKTNTLMDYLANPINLTLDYDVQKANLRRLNHARFSYFNPEANNWQSVGFPTGTIANSVSGVVSRLGRYTVVGSRR